MKFVQKASNHIIWKIETFIAEDIRCKKHCTKDNDTSVPFTVGTLGSHTILPIAISCPVIFSWISSVVWNLFPFKDGFSLGKSQKLQGAKHEHPRWGWATWMIRWFDFTKNSARDMIHEWVHCGDEAAHHQLPIAVAFWIIQIVSSMEECSSFFKLNTKFEADCCSTHSVILNVTATQYTCSTTSLNCISYPHWLVQWSHHCSHMDVPVHSPCLPGYMDDMQTVLMILAMASLFPNRLYIYKHIYVTCYYIYITYTHIHFILFVSLYQRYLIWGIR